MQAIDDAQQELIKKLLQHISKQLVVEEKPKKIRTKKILTAEQQIAMNERMKKLREKRAEKRGVKNDYTKHPPERPE